MERSLFGTLREALALWPKWPSLVAIAVLTAEAASVRWLSAEFLDAAFPRNLLANLVAGTILPAVVGLFVIFLLAGTLLAPQAGGMRPLWWRAIGLYLLAQLTSQLVTSVLTFVVFAFSPGYYSPAYGISAIVAVAHIVAFPIMVRAILAAAGVREPRLGATISGMLGKARPAYFWNAVVALFFAVLVVFAFSNFLGIGAHANELFWSIVEAAMAEIGDVLRLLLAIVAARILQNGVPTQAAVFA
jgi:hypothetical protein